MMNETCKSCRFWHALERQRTKDGAVDMSGPRFGECRRRLVAALMMIGGKMQIPAGYPPMPESFPACGEHEALLSLPVVGDGVREEYEGE